MLTLTVSFFSATPALIGRTELIRIRVTTTSEPNRSCSRGEVDGRYTAMTRMVGIASDPAGTALPLLELRAAGTTETQLAGEPVVAFWVPGGGSALDAS